MNNKRAQFFILVVTLITVVAIFDILVGLWFLGILFVVVNSMIIKKEFFPRKIPWQVQRGLGSRLTNKEAQRWWRQKNVTLGGASPKWVWLWGDNENKELVIHAAKNAERS